MNWLLRAGRVALLSLFATNPLTALVFLGYTLNRQRALVYGDRMAAHLIRSPDRSTFIARWFGSLWPNFRTGAGAAAASMMLILPSGVLMLVSWYAGWNNSFNKGYEYAAIGPVTGLGGLILAMFTMTYLPVAQARFATTGQWRDLYDWHTNLQIIVCQPARLVLLAVVGAVIGGMLLIARGMPTFLGNNIPPDANPAGLLTFWFVILGLIFVPLYLLFKDTTAATYHRGMKSAISHRRLMKDQLAPNEQPLLLDVAVANDAEYRPVSRSRIGFTLLIVAMTWFPAFAMLYVQQFVNNLGAWGWLNYPLVWVPMIAYGPG